MQRWFFLRNRKAPQKSTKPKMTDIAPSPIKEIPFTEWLFSVKVPEIGAQEKVCLTGNIAELGDWDFSKAVILEHELGTDTWTKTIIVPNTTEIYYRYAICIVDQESNEISIRLWETHLHPRIIKENDLHPLTDEFGEYDGQHRVSRGWLTKQTMIQLQFLNNPINLKPHLAGRLLHVKVTPVKLSLTGQEQQQEDLSLSTDNAEVPYGVSVEVSTLSNDTALCIIKPQEQFGREYKPNDILIFNVMTFRPEILAYLIDFYSYSTRSKSDDPPYHVGYAYVLPNMFKQSTGTLMIPVTCNTKHRPLGSVTIHYLIVKPMETQLCDLKISYAKHWDPSWTGLEVGHRGLGASFKKKEGSAIRENTIASLNKAAASGADLLEFDVQLSKDLIPIIYHDFHVCISMKRKKEIDFTEMLELPVKDLTMEQLQKLKVYHLVEGRNHETLFNDEDLEEHQPFPALQNVLEVINPNVGFNVELKWTMELDDGTFELNNPFDMNTYVDKVLEVVLKYASDRRIIFSCFNPDICTLVRLKQNKYPVMFLTVGVTSKYQPYRDPRCLSIPAAVQHAISSDILGIVVHTEDLLRDPTQVQLAKDAGLVIFCWGDDNNDKNTIMKLKSMGLHAVIYDKLDEYITKEIKESVFMVGARESQREMMRRAAHDEAEPASSSGHTLLPSSEETERPYLDLTVRNRLQDYSTVTSLESLGSDIYDDAYDGNLKRSNDHTNVISVDKESQLKQQPKSFKGLLPAGDNTQGSPKKTRRNHDK